ncbi:hypothetical protein CN157_16035 [Sinorhizobium meliloti]|nr:hypothetical protein CN157_16035 [Sinorhizobium meliloti]RVL07866.1 hypothetical protein CN149_28750 [Sinorhizobium meliloti]RVQ81305.1 hypothetical protein CN061_03425 [Sinorhizobium meliloti]
MLATLAIIVLAASGPSPTCIAAAHRFTSFLIEEAKGTRHEAQIGASTEAAGGLDKKVQEIAASMSEDRCAFIIAAPDSTVRALAIAALPERNGK